MQREIWARGFMDYDIETKGESSQWVGKRFPCPPPKKKHDSLDGISKYPSLIFCDFIGVLQKSFAIDIMACSLSLFCAKNHVTVLASLLSRFDILRFFYACNLIQRSMDGILTS